MTSRSTETPLSLGLALVVTPTLIRSLIARPRPSKGSSVPARARTDVQAVDAKRSPKLLESIAPAGEGRDRVGKLKRLERRQAA